MTFFVSGLEGFVQIRIIDVTIKSFSYHSLSFEIKLRFEIGLKFPYISWSRESFLRMGSTTACLKAVGTLAFFKDRLMMSVITGSKVL